MTAELKLLERLIRHQVMIQRLSSGQIKRALPILRQLAKDLRARIAAGEATEFAMGRMLTLERDIQVLVTEATDSIQQQLELEAFATQEIDFTQRLLGAAVTVDLAQGINTDMVAAVTTRRQLTLVSGDTVKRLTVPQMFDELSAAVGRDALRTVQAGVIEGRTQQDMARDVARMVTTRSRRQAETVIRTAVNGIGGAARNEVFAANSDIIEGERWISTMDSRVTLVCAGRDQTLYRLGVGPRPPAHYGCRSIMAPEIKPEYRIATKGERATQFGPRSNQLTYAGFLKEQSVEFQNDVLGAERAKLFRSGELKIEQFTDDMGRTLTLDELRSRYDLTMA